MSPLWPAWGCSGLVWGCRSYLICSYFCLGGRLFPEALIPRDVPHKAGSVIHGVWQTSDFFCLGAKPGGQWTCRNSQTGGRCTLPSAFPSSLRGLHCPHSFPPWLSPCRTSVPPPCLGKPPISGSKLANISHPSLPHPCSESLCGGALLL